MASDFNWADHPIAEESGASDKKESKSSDFNWDDHPIAAGSHQDKTSAGRAALVGAGQGATFGFGEELTAPVVAGGAMIHDAFSSPDNKSVPTLPGGESTWDKYSRLMQTYRDTARDEQKTAQSEHPYAYTGGAMAGGLLAPGLGAGKALGTVSKLGTAAESAAAPAIGSLGASALKTGIKAAGGAGIGAGVGGLYGAGEAEGDVSERLPAAEEAAKTGAKVGAFIPIAGAGLSTAGKALDKVTELPFFKKSIEAFKRGTEGENLITESGRREAGDVVRQKSGELYNDIKKLKTDVGQQIGGEINSSTEQGTKLDITDDVNSVMAKLKEIKASGSKDAASHADGIEREIKKILGIKAETENGSFAGVPKEELPEGLVLPQEETTAPQTHEITPNQAQDLKQVLNPYTPKSDMLPQQVEPAQLAKDFSNTVSGKLTEAVPALADKETPVEGQYTTKTEPGLNSQYGSIKDSLKRLTVNERRLPEQIKEKINNVVSKLGNEDMSGDNARALVQDVLQNIEEVSPEIANKYRNTLDDISGRLKLSGEIGKGLQNFGLGTFQALGKAGANAAGLAVNKITGGSAAEATGTPIASLQNTQALNNGVNAPQQPGMVNKVKSFANTVLSNVNTPASRISASIENPDTLSRIKNAEPYAYQRQVAQAAENAEPDTLKQQAQQVRQQYGNQGEQLATVLEKMADQGKDSRRALMFTIMQNPAYKKMLGVTGEQAK